MNDNKQLRDEAIDWLYVCLGTSVYCSLIALTLWLLP